MKNQYFGDRRDYFKLNLLFDLLEGTQLQQLVSVLMLTQNDVTGEGRLTAFPVGAGRPTVHKFLTIAVGERRRRVSELRELMVAAGVTYVPHHDDKFFEHDLRNDYFNELRHVALDPALVFFDPDIGIEIKNRASMKRSGLQKYLLKSDIRKVCEFAPTSTLFVVYQHFQKDKRKVPGDLLVRARDFGLAASLGDVVSVRDGDVAFLIGSRDSVVHASARSVALQHATSHQRDCQTHKQALDGAFGTID